MKRKNVTPALLSLISLAVFGTSCGAVKQSFRTASETASVQQNRTQTHFSLKLADINGLEIDLPTSGSHGLALAGGSATVLNFDLYYNFANHLNLSRSGIANPMLGDLGYEFGAAIPLGAPDNAIRASGTVKFMAPSANGTLEWIELPFSSDNGDTDVSVNDTDPTRKVITTRINVKNDLANTFSGSAQDIVGPQPQSTDYVVEATWYGSDSKDCNVAIVGQIDGDQLTLRANASATTSEDMVFYSRCLSFATAQSEANAPTFSTLMPDGTTRDGATIEVPAGNYAVTTTAENASGDRVTATFTVTVREAGASSLGGSGSPAGGTAVGGASGSANIKLWYDGYDGVSQAECTAWLSHHEQLCANDLAAAGLQSDMFEMQCYSDGTKQITYTDSTKSKIEKIELKYFAVISCEGKKVPGVIGPSGASGASGAGPGQPPAAPLTPEQQVYTSPFLQSPSNLVTTNQNAPTVTLTSACTVLCYDGTMYPFGAPVADVQSTADDLCGQGMHESPVCSDTSFIVQSNE